MTSAWHPPPLPYPPTPPLTWGWKEEAISPVGKRVWRSFYRRGDWRVRGFEWEAGLCPVKKMGKVLPARDVLGVCCNHCSRPGRGLTREGAG